MKALLISYFFPPYNTAGAVRVGKHAKYLLQHGQDVRVVTAANKIHATWLRPTLPIEFPEERVVRVDPSMANLWVGRGGSSHWLWSRPALNATMSLMKEWIPDVILACALPPSPLLVAGRLSSRGHVPWVAEFRDLWAENHNYSHARKALLGLLERQLLRTASGFVTVSEPLAERLREKYHRPTAVVTNGFDRCDYPIRMGPTSDDRVLNILYAGWIYSGKQDLAPLVLALRLLGPLADQVKITFLGSGPEQRLQSIVRGPLPRSFALMDSVPYLESLRLQAAADVLLFLLWNDPKERGVYTSKLFEYVGARRPILAIGPEGDVASDLILRRSLGVVLRDPELIAEQIRRWIERKSSGAIPVSERADALGLTREDQTRVLEEFLVRSCGHDRQSSILEPESE